MTNLFSIVCVACLLSAHESRRYQRLFKSSPSLETKLNSKHLAAPTILMNLLALPRSSSAAGVREPLRSLGIHNRISLDAKMGLEDESKQVSDAEVKRLQADKLRLQAEIAELQAKNLDLKAQQQTPVSDTVTSSSENFASTPAPAPAELSAFDEFQAFLSTAARKERLTTLDALQEVTANAWEAGRLAQQAEIETLGVKLNTLREQNSPSDSNAWSIGSIANKVFNQGGTGARKINPISVLDMLGPSGNTAEERRSHARDFTRAAFEYFATAPITTDIDSNDAVRVDGTVTSRAAIQNRLKILMQHEGAGSVEYRIFAVELAKDDKFEDAAGTNTTAYFDFNDFSDFSSSTFSKYPWLTEFIKATEIPIFSSMMNDGDDADWFEASSEENVAPSIALCTGCLQGNLEVVVIYYFARILAQFNEKRIALQEGRPVPANINEIIDQRESSYFDSDLEQILTPVVGFFLLTLVLDVFLIWQLVSFFTSGLDAPPTDLLAF